MLDKSWDFEPYEYPDWEFDTPTGTLVAFGKKIVHICRLCGRQDAA